MQNNISQYNIKNDGTFYHFMDNISTCNICSHPDSVSFREGLAYFSKTMQNYILHPSQQQKEKSPGAAVALICLQSRPFTNRKHLVHHETKYPATKTQDCWVARILHQTRMWHLFWNWGCRFISIVQIWNYQISSSTSIFFQWQKWILVHNIIQYMYNCLIKITYSCIKIAKMQLHLWVCFYIATMQ